MPQILAFRLTKYLAGRKKNLLAAFLAISVVSFCALFLGKAFKEFIDYGLKNPDPEAAGRYLYIIAGGLFLFGLSSFCRSYFINDAAEKVTGELRAELFKKISSLETYEFEKLKIAEALGALNADMELVSKLIVDFLSFFLRNLILSAGSFFIMFRLSSKLSLFSIIFLSISLVPIIIIARNTRESTKKFFDSRDSLFREAEEALSNFSTLAAFGNGEITSLRFKKSVENYLKISSKRFLLRAFFFACSISSILFSLFAVIWVGYWDIVEGKISAGGLTSFLYYAFIFGLGAGGIVETFSGLKKPLYALERIFAFLDLKSGFNREKFLPFKISEKKEYSLEFEEVSFSYPSRPSLSVLKNISFKVRAKSFTGIKGISGAGKSTLGRLAVKFYPNFEGSIKIYGMDIKNLDPYSLRKEIIYLPQGESIFSDTIKFNISLGDPEISEEEIYEAASIAGVRDFSDKLDQGLDTPLGRKGADLSGGQKQRVLIARALVRKPKVLIMDESTNALDASGESVLLSKIRKKLIDTTIILISHRKSALEKTDRIIDLNLDPIK